MTLANSLGPKCAPFVQLEFIEAFQIKSNKFLNFIWFFIHAINWSIPPHFDQGKKFNIGFKVGHTKGNNVSSKVNIGFLGGIFTSISLSIEVVTNWIIGWTYTIVVMFLNAHVYSSIHNSWIIELSLFQKNSHLPTIDVISFTFAMGNTSIHLATNPPHFLGLLSYGTPIISCSKHL